MSSSVNSPYWLASTAATVHAMRLKVRSGRCLLWVVKISRGERRRDPRMPPICCAAAHLRSCRYGFDAASATRRQSQRFPACPLAGASIENYHHAPLDACARRQFHLAEFLMWHGSSPQTRGASSANQDAHWRLANELHDAWLCGFSRPTVEVLVAEQETLERALAAQELAMLVWC